MRATPWFGTLVAASALVASAAAAAAADPPSLALARKTLDARRGENHAEKMRVNWTDLADEVPPDGAEVVIVRGYISYEASRLVLRAGKVEAGCVWAAQSWFYNRKGESFGAAEFDVNAEAFALAWNAARRILAASDERIEPEPEDRPLRGIYGSARSHESVDWIRVRGGPASAPLHCADRPSRSYDWDGVRTWRSLRDRSVFDLFADLLPERDAGRRPAEVAAWTDFAVAEVRASSDVPAADRLRRDGALLDTCFRVLGEAGDASAEPAVAAFARAIGELDRSHSAVRSVREEASSAATRLRIRLHWDREDVIRTLRSLPKGTWALEDQAKWLRRTFRERDPEGWIAFLIEEATRGDARPQDVVAAATEMRALPAETAVPLLRALLVRADPYVRLEAALALHEIDPADASARATVSEIALDRSIACGWRADLTDRWCRNRALEAALDWGGLTERALRSHVLAAEPDDPEFLESACRRLSRSAEALSAAEVRDAWRLVLSSRHAEHVLAAVRHLAESGDAASKARMLAALDRIDPRRAPSGSDADTGSAETVARWRESVRLLPDPDDPPK